MDDWTDLSDDFNKQTEANFKQLGEFGKSFDNFGKEVSEATSVEKHTSNFTRNVMDKMAKKSEVKKSTQDLERHVKETREKQVKDAKAFLDLVNKGRGQLFL